MSERRPRLILAYAIVALGALALVGALTRQRTLMGFAAGLAYLTAIVHGISFAIRSRRRRQPAVLLGSARWILAVTLAAIAAVSLANFVLIAVFIGRGPVSTAADVGPAFMWATVLMVLAYRAWIVPSARRAGILQALAIVLAVPGFIGTIASATRPFRSAIAADTRLVLDTSILVTFIVIAAAGPVLDNLFASIDDRRPDALPEAVLRA